MDTEDYINKIKQKALQCRSEAAKKIQEEDALRQKLHAEIASHQNEIKDMIGIFNALLDNHIPGICRDSLETFSRTYKDGYFFSHPLNHTLGFLSNKEYTKGCGKISAIGIYNGGAAGNYDLVIDISGDIYMRHHNTEIDSREVVIPITELKQAIKEYPVFKEEFYNYLNRILQ